MKRVTIQDKLQELGTPIEDMALGDFDAVGEYTAKKARNPNDPLYKTAGAFFRPNYERGMLADALIRALRPKSILEIGFGRGYWTTCAARTVKTLGLETKITSVDMQFDKKHIEFIGNAFSQWLNGVTLVQGKSHEVIPKLEDESWDIIYIDGDHTYDGVKRDWELVKDRFNQLVVFDDYNPEESNVIQIKSLVDEIELEKELVVMDRLVFQDDRGYTPEEKNYGQVIVYKDGFEMPKNEYSYDW